MDFIIASNKPTIPMEGGLGPHFYEVHGNFAHEKDGEAVYELSLAIVVSYLDKHKDDFEGAYTAVADILGNAGISVRHDLFKKGERDPLKLFKLQSGISHGITDGGVEIIMVPLEDVVNLYVLHYNKQSGHHTIYLDILREHGLELNEDRILTELCPTCKK